MLKDLGVEAFITAIAAKEPTPGGGSAGALAAATGAALGVMAMRYSRSGGEEPLDALRVEFTGLIDEDARAYRKVREAYKLPRDSAGRRETIEQATLGAAEVPLEGVRRCGRALSELVAFAPDCSRNLASDLAAGAILLKAAAEVMAQNVVINVGSLKDAEAAGRLTREMEAALSAVKTEAEKLNA